MCQLGLNLALQGGDEQRHLWALGFDCQIQVLRDGDGTKCLKYTENGVTKTNQSRRGGGKSNFLVQMPCTTGTWTLSEMWLFEKYVHQFVTQWNQVLCFVQIPCKWSEIDPHSLVLWQANGCEFHQKCCEVSCSKSWLAREVHELFSVQLAPESCWRTVAWSVAWPQETQRKKRLTKESILGKWKLPAKFDTVEYQIGLPHKSECVNMDCLGNKAHKHISLRRSSACDGMCNFMKLDKVADKWRQKNSLSPKYWSKKNWLTLFDSSVWMQTSTCLLWLQHVCCDFNMFVVTSTCLLWLQHVCCECHLKMCKRRTHVRSVKKKHDQFWTWTQPQHFWSRMSEWMVIAEQSRNRRCTVGRWATASTWSHHHRIRFTMATPLQELVLHPEEMHREPTEESPALLSDDHRYRWVMPKFIEISGNTRLGGPDNRGLA